jgi:phage protein D
MNSERNYQTNITDRLKESQGVANQTLQGRIAAATTRAEMLQGMTGNMAGVRDKELTRLNSQYDTAQEGLIRSANMGGYNPGRALGELNKSRVVDADLEAWSRAVNLITGQTNVLNLLSGQPIDQAAQLAGTRATGTAGSNSTQTGASELGTGIAQVVPAGLLSYNIARQYNSGGPAASPQQVQVPNYVNGVQVGY